MAIGGRREGQSLTEISIRCYKITVCLAFNSKVVYNLVHNEHGYAKYGGDLFCTVNYLTPYGRNKNISRWHVVLFFSLYGMYSNTFFFTLNLSTFNFLFF